MEFDRPDIRVTAALQDIEFLALDDARYGPLFEDDRDRLLAIAHNEAAQPLPGGPDTIWRTPEGRWYRPPAMTGETATIEFGSGASEVFNSITTGCFDPSLPLLSQPPLALLHPPPPLPPPSFVPVPPPLSHPSPPSAPQHIHINNFTANLNYHAAAAAAGTGLLPVVSRTESGGLGPSPQQPVPFVGAHFPGGYVAPFPPASPPMFPPPTLPPPYHQMLMMPPGPSLHFSMFPPGGPYPPPLLQQAVTSTSSYTAEQRPGLPPSMCVREPKIEPLRESGNSSNIVFGSTAVVSVKHSSSDEESSDEARRSKSDQRIVGSEEEDEDIIRDDIVGVIDAETQSNIPSMQTRYPDGNDINSTIGDSEQICEEVASFSRQKQLQGEAEQEEKTSDDEGSARQGHRDDSKVPPAAPDDLPVASGPRPTPPPFPNLKAVLVTMGSPTPPPGQSETPAHPDGLTNALHQQAGGSQAKSWASLFSPPNPGVERIYSEKPTARIPPFSAKNENEGVGGHAAAAAPTGSLSEDRTLAEFLRSYQLNHVAPALLPRGLSNRSNWCFVNAILQALLACPPFYNLIKSLPGVPGVGLRSGRSATPMIDAVVEFVNEFSALEAMNKSQKKDRGRKREDLPVGAPLEPGYVYRTLLQLEADTFKVQEGRQEDAEEFLTCLLNMLSDEMQSLIKLAEAPPRAQADQDHEGISSLSAGQWVEMGSRGRSCITRRISQPNLPVTPIQKLASGLCRSSVRSSNAETSATLQPFFALQLDIQSSTVHSVMEALLENFSSEQLEGSWLADQEQQQQQLPSRVLTLSLEELPPVLILHLKRMLYDGSTGGCVKVMKWVDFAVDLEIGREMLSLASKTKYTLKQRQYKLFGVVYHNGREATKGHYVADVYHTGYSCWLRCDDSSVRPVPEQTVTTPLPGSAPYILFYRRADTLVGMDKAAK